MEAEIGCDENTQAKTAGFGKND